jgi:hypothetical protein
MVGRTSIFSPSFPPQPLGHSSIPLFGLQPFAQKFSKEHIISDALPIYRKLSSDDQDSVRLLTVEDLITIAEQLDPKEVKDQLLAPIRQSVFDKSWRVRYMVANHFVRVRCHFSTSFVPKKKIKNRTLI